MASYGSFRASNSGRRKLALGRIIWLGCRRAFRRPRRSGFQSDIRFSWFISRRIGVMPQKRLQSLRNETDDVILKLKKRSPAAAAF